MPCGKYFSQEKYREKGDPNTDQQYSIVAPITNLLSLTFLTKVLTSDGHTFVYLLHRYRYIVNYDRYKRTPSVICL
jgi:hypothetical protein